MQQESGVNPCVALGVRNTPSSVFASLKNMVQSCTRLFYDLNMNEAQKATVKSLIGALEVVRHDVKHTRIILTLMKFCTYVDSHNRQK